MASKSEPSTLAPETSSQPHEYPGAMDLSFLTVAMCISVFLVSLDRSIIATAIPQITNEFHSYVDIGWYSSAYLITATTFKPAFGKILISFKQKPTFLTATAFFSTGSLICGVAPNSVALIIGRAVAGIGGAGILTGAYVAAAHCLPLSRRPLYIAVVGSMYGIGAITGPLLGGIFTDRVTWRWCFYLNLPMEGVNAILIWLYFNPPQKDSRNRTTPNKILSLDLIGNSLFLATFIMLFLALQFNEQGYAWKTPRIAGLLVGSGLMLISTALWQWHQGENALTPPKIMTQRTVVFSCLGAIFLNGAMLIIIYYLPIWFQAVRNDNAFTSGIHLLPNVLANIVFNFVAASLVSKTGYYVPLAIVGAAVATGGCGLLITLQVSTPASQWIGFEFLAGAGIGMAIQQSVVAVQTVLSLEMLPIGVAVVGCSQDLGGAIFVAVADSVLQNQLLHRAKPAIPDVDVAAVLQAGATRFRTLVPQDELDTLVLAYNNALQKVFVVAVVLCGLTFLSGFGLEWKNVKKMEQEAGSSPLS